jgi:tetratricopeptide (TPR) repeat protein
MIVLLPQLTPSELLRYSDLAPFINELLQRSRDQRQEGSLSKAERFALDALSDSREAGDRISQGTALVCLADVHREMGKLGTALSDCQRAHRIFQRQPSRYQRHNEAVAAYAQGLMLHLLGDDVDALKWYRTAGNQFEKARREWAAVNDLKHVEACDYVLCWLKTLTRHLITAQAGTDVNLFTRFQVPLIRSKDDKGRFTIVEMEIDRYRFDSHVTINGDTFRLQSIDGNHPISLKPETRCYVLQVPVEAYESLGAGEGDSALIVWGKYVGQEGPAVLEALSGPEFGSFKRDDKGVVNFVSFKTAVVIGGEEIADDFEVGYIVALLKELPSEPISGRFEPSASSREPEPPGFYAKLLHLVSDNKEVADRLIEYERQFDPKADASVLAEKAIARILGGNQ